MARALQLAARGLATTTPNPRVGCVIVRDGVVLAEGWHRKAGEPHAEALALQAAGADARGATVYASLEPCSHHGRTPPCADALIAAGVARVVAAMEDPNPRVAGEGIRRLAAAGIVTETGLLESEARELNVGFVSRMTRGRPWMRVKIAASLDGKTSLANGVSQWITGAAARRDGHRWRARSCAVLTGIGTLKDDDPRLTVRDVPAERQPLRVVVDSRLRIGLDARILEGGGVVVATATDDPAKARALAAAGAEVWVLPDVNGKVELAALARELAQRGINEVLVEAGINLHSALVAAGVVDEFVIYLAPHLLGDAGRGMIRLPGIERLEERLQLEVRDLRAFGSDLRLIARVGGR
ncbi:MAG: bifunctional diaminohydroxyphosphoribosylaminopyrimidine deaminase/5-amino-6-(5-phosphoribosylamino)uracil reductase RibD [Burkholderiales bacterium]|nr:bifunctional diaminohydroxyphosphoribosylaminopyrimidine deaminase/5-amino-6-(5-phosphoribosylamino)uracil reductase RibD [Burkholderiales bacterium]